MSNTVIVIDGFEFDNIDLAIKEVEEQYGFEVDDWESFLQGKTLENLNDFLLYVKSELVIK